MTIKQIFLAKLANAGYKAPQNLNVWEDEDFNKYLQLLESERQHIFHIMYGDNLIEDRGQKKIKEHMYRLIEAEKDLQQGLIPCTMYYILTQIKIGKLQI